MIHITDKAKEKILELANSEGIAPSIRIKAIGGSCAGMKNDMCFEELATEFDEIIKVDDISIIIDQFSLNYMDEMTVDYVENDFAQGFKFIGAGSKSCGCGSSWGY